MAKAGPDLTMVGRTIGNFLIEGVIGRGGMATVFLARQLDLDRSVALKVLAPHLGRDPKQVDQFTREARTLAKLEHPNILPIYACGREGDLCWLAAQLVKGGSLRGIIDERGRLPVETAIGYVIQMARGLLEAHKAGIVHRDVKPDNVLIGPNTTLKLADFGLALMLDDATQTARGVVGTPHYMPPEAIDGLEVDARADIYSLGATLYVLLTGETPFEAGTPFELLLKHVNEPLVPPHERVEGIPEPISRVVMRMMAKDRAARYASVEEVLRDLERPPPLPPPDAPPPRQAKPAPVAELLLAETLPPLNYQRRRAPLPRQLSWAAIGLAAVGAVGVVASLGKIKAVLADLGGALESLDTGEEAAVLARRRLDAELAGLDPEARAARLTAFAKERSGTGAALAAEQDARALLAGLAKSVAAGRAERLAQVEARLAAGEPGPALDLLAALTSELQGAEAEQARGLGEKAAALLASRGVVWVSGGRFTCGEGSSSRPEELPGLYVDRTEVTNARWARFLATTRGAPPPPPGWSGPVPPAGKAEHPVTGITMAEARLFASWCGRRIPDALEWEKAARGADGRRWPWGDAADPTACAWGPEAPRAVGTSARDKSPWGCLDLAGNVSELVRPPSSPLDAPRPWIKGGGPATRVFVHTRPAFWQEGLGPEDRHPAIGFRCVAERFPPEEPQ